MMLGRKMVDRQALGHRAADPAFGLVLARLVEIGESRIGGQRVLDGVVGPEAAGDVGGAEVEEALQAPVLAEVPGQAEGLVGAADVDPSALLLAAVEVRQGGDVEELADLAAQPVAVGAPRGRSPGGSRRRRRPRRASPSRSSRPQPASSRRRAVTAREPPFAADQQVERPLGRLEQLLDEALAQGAGRSREEQGPIAHRFSSVGGAAPRGGPTRGPAAADRRWSGRRSGVRVVEPGAAAGLRSTNRQ